MNSKFSDVKIKQEPVCTYGSSQMEDPQGEPSGVDYGIVYRGISGNARPTTVSWSKHADNACNAAAGMTSHSSGTLDLHGGEFDCELKSDNVEDASTWITGHMNDLFRYDEESDSDDGSTAPPQAKDVNNDEHYTWTNQLSTSKVYPFSGMAGSASAGCKTSGAPVDFFHQFFPEELYKQAQTETNNFAEYYQEKRRDLGRDWWEWTDVAWEPVESKREIRVFMGICVVMAVHSLPNPRDYWSKQKNVGNTLIAKSSMNMHRFDKIMHYFYLSNPWRDPEKIANPDRRVEACNRDPLYKVSRALHEHVKNTCSYLYHPHQDVVMQELTGIVSSKSDFRTNGWKVLALRDALTGYVSSFQWYYDQDRVSESNNQGTTQQSAVISLTKHLAGKGHCLYADSVYISPAVAHQFTDLHTHITTNCSDWPKDIMTSQNLEPGSTVSLQYNGVTATTWQGKRVKRCLSTIHDGSMQPVVLKLRNPTTREHTIKMVLCPSIVARHDTILDKLPKCLLLSQGSVLQKLTNSWWKRLVWLLIDICMNNAYVLWTVNKRQNLSYSEFAMEVASKLICDAREEPLKQGIEVSTVTATSQEAVNTSLTDPQPSVISYSVQPTFQLRYPVNQHSLPETVTVQASGQPDPSIGDQLSDSDLDEVEHCLVKFPGRGRNCKQCTADQTRTRSGRRRDTQFGCMACGLNLCRSGCFVRFHEAHGLKITTASMAEIKMLNEPPPVKRQKLSF